MRKLLFMLIVLPILLFAGANQAVDSTAWSRIDSLPISSYWLRQQGYEYISLFRYLDIDSAGTTMVWDPIWVIPYNVFSERIPHKGDSLRIEYQLGMDLTYISNYGDWNWLVDTTNTGPDSTWIRALGGNWPLGSYLWKRYINLKLVDRDSIPIYFSGKEQ